MTGKKVSFGGIRGAGVVMTLALFLLSCPVGRTPCLANPASGLFDLLNPAISRDLGLGGDPFRSAVMDQASWWGESMQADRPALRYQLEYFEPVSPWLTEGKGHLSHVGNEIRGASSLRIGRGRIFGQAGLSHQDQELVVDDQGKHYALYGKGNQGDLLIRVQDLPENLEVQFSTPLASSSDRMRSVPLGFGLRYGIEENFIFQVSRVRYLYDHALDIAIEDDFIESSLNLERWTWTIDSRMYLNPDSWFAYSWQTDDFDEIETLTDAHSYEIIPTGRTTSSNIDFVLGWGGGQAILLRGSWQDFDLGGKAYWGGQQFGKVNYFRGDHRTGVLGYESDRGGNNRWVADLTLTEIRGRFWGKIESWPFSDSVGDLLGGRLTFRGQFRAQWSRLHAGRDMSVGRGRLKVGLAWYNVFPEAQVQHWQSSLGFPVTSREYYELETDHLQLGALSLGGVIPWGSFRIDLEIFQFVYGNVHNNVSGSGEGGEGEAPPAEEVELPGGWYGGTYARVSVGYGF